MLASSALRDVIEGPRREARVLGRSGHALWAAVGDRVIVVSRPAAVRLPNCVVVDELPDGGSFGAGCGAMVIGGRPITVTRWWDPKPVLAKTSVAELLRPLGVLTELVGTPSDPALTVALARRDPVAVILASRALLGLGPGLTPSGDDQLAGALAAFLQLGKAVCDHRATHLIASVRSPLLEAAARQTTALSSTLLNHALNGEVVRPMARVLSALTGQGSIEDALAALLQVGHTSGHALAGGVLVGATAVCGGTP